MSDSSLIVDIQGIGSFSSGSKVMGLVGPSGCGKTTLMEQIAGLRSCDMGSITLGQKILLNKDRTINITADKREIGFVFQDKLLFPHMTVSANINFPATVKRSRPNDIHAIIKALNLESLMDKYPHQISGGEKQRVCLARAICSQPKLLILDEPTAGLDPKLRENVLALLRQLMKYIECPILFVSHYMDDIIELCDKLTVMAEGKIIATGPLDEVLSKAEIRPFIGCREIITELEGEVSLDDVGMLELKAGSIVLRLENDYQADSRRRIRIRARDVALALKAPSKTSMQNIIPGIITKILDHDPHGTLVTVALGTDGGGPEIKSLITKQSKKDLHLTAGLNISVMIKAVAVQTPT